MKRQAADRAGAEGYAGEREDRTDHRSGFGDGAAHSGPQFERRLRRRDLTGVREVRAELRRFLARWGAPGRAETAELLTSELVTNALVHTDGGAVVKAVFTGAVGAGFTGAAGRAKGRLRVEVRDFMAGHPALGGPGTDIGPVRDVVPEMNDIEKAATSGRGLLLVHALSDGWGVCAHGVGKSVWFELAAQEP
ncbi:ATP-binding protein [Streptomyces aureoversilis]|uniref:ATP-binding protein n=1 Tax=Streptomyces aureoversilis TaxID=67277 RepID=A0ABW0A346_9ACTN